MIKSLYRFCDQLADWAEEIGIDAVMDAIRAWTLHVMEERKTLEEMKKNAEKKRKE